jgi:hypothetical protein
MRKNSLVMAVLLVVIIVGAAWGAQAGYAQTDGTPTPYAIPTHAPDVDGDRVITRVGDTTITLDEFQQRVRFERWFRLYQLARQVEKHGPDEVLDLTRAENEQVAALFATLADSNTFGVQVQRVMVINAIVRQETAQRELELDPVLFDSRLAQYLGLTLGAGGQFPPGFDDEYAAFVAQMTRYTGLSEDDFLRIVEAATLYKQLEHAFSQDPDAIPAGTGTQVGVQVRDVFAGSGPQADEIVARMEAGERLADIAADLDLALITGGLHIFDQNGTSLPPEVVARVMAADSGDIVGPVETAQGWYVARVGNEVFEVLSPKEVEELRKRYFLDWIEAQMDDADYVQDLDNWFDHIPQDPLPQDVSLLLRDENVTRAADQ